MNHETLTLPPNIERDMVTRTRHVLRRRSWTLALALFFTCLPLVFAFDGSTITFFMARDERIATPLAERGVPLVRRRPAGPAAADALITAAPARELPWEPRS